MMLGLSTSVRFGSASGKLFWQVESCSFGASLGLGGPPPFDRPLVVGGRPGEFITVDALINHLSLLGLAPDGRSLDTVTRFRGRVTRTFGDVELAGLTTEAGRELLIVCPDGRTIALRPPLDHRAHRFDWGSGSSACGAGPFACGDATMATARELIGRSWGRGWGPEEELAAEALARNHLDRCGASFSFAANSLCDWYLFDREPTTGLTLGALTGLARR